MQLKAVSILLGAVLLVLIVGVCTMRRTPFGEIKRISVVPEKLIVTPGELILLGYRTEHFGIEDSRCGLMERGYVLRGNSAGDSNATKKRWFFTMGLKPTVVILSGDMVEIQCDAAYVPTEAAELYIFSIENSLPRDPQIFIHLVK